jgi:hypothetical protein
MDKQKERNQEAYTEEQVKDTEAFLTQLKELPAQSLETGRLLAIGFMNGLDAAQLASRR